MNHLSPEKWWMPLLAFATHSLVALLIFFLIAAPAVLLDRVVYWLEAIGTGATVVAGLRLLEYGILGVDLGLVFIVVPRAAWKAIRKLW
jgi:hypothetical protein